MYPSLVDDNFWFWTVQKRLKLIPHGKFKVWWVYLYVGMCVFSGQGWEDNVVDGRSHHQRPPWWLPGHVCQRTRLFCFMWFPKIRSYGDTVTPHHRHHLHPAQTLTEQKQWESRGWSNMSAVGRDPYLFLWVLQAASHRQVTHRCAVRSLNTDSLCSHSSAWEEPCATHHNVFKTKCVTTGIL